MNTTDLLQRQKSTSFENAPHQGMPLPTRLAFIGNYLPRQCGLATFTTDLCTAISDEYGDERLFAIAVNDPDSHYDYPERVRLEIDQEDCSSYERAAEFLNFNGNDLVCLQHEYGIFGGPAGSHILSLIRNLKMPIVTTLHTVLREPDHQQREVLETICGLSDRLVVMSQHAARMLREVYGVPSEKIDVIPHGVLDLPFTDPNYLKDKFGTEGKSVLLTFGLLSPNKGIENVIQALPAILKHHPNLMYVVSGATHPQIKRRDGERYRESLQQLAERLGVAAHVTFNNHFLSTEELVEQLSAADVYITPYRQEAQVVSGTLAIALGAGKAIISTPYWHARELLADGRGVIIPFDDAAALAAATIAMLDNDAERHSMRKRAYLYARETTWQRTAQAYMLTFQQARTSRMLRPQPIVPEENSSRQAEQLPLLNTTHLSNMTDDTGLIQHAIFSLPNNEEGYTTDDNARALIVTTLLNGSGQLWSPEHSLLSRRYLAFLLLAFNHEKGRFRNFLSYGRDWKEEVGSEDSHGRALWALGTVFCYPGGSELRGAAARLFENALAATSGFTSPRAWAFSLLGVHAYLECFPGDRKVQAIRNELAGRLLDVYERSHTVDWLWFEQSLSYSNARLAEAMLLAGIQSAQKRMTDVGLESLRWLLAEQHRTDKGIFVPIGSSGFYPRGGVKARFDQQPVEACATVSACLHAYKITGEQMWVDEAWSAFRWFLGENDLSAPLYDATTGGCCDGLHPDRVNENQGAESTISFLMALLDMRAMESLTSSTNRAEMSVTL